MKNTISNSLKFVEAKPWITWAIYMAATALVYLQATRYPVFSPVVIHPTSIDEQIPFMPSSAYVYITYFLLFPVLILIARNREGFGTVYTTGILCGLVNVSIYSLFPTMLPVRPDAPDLTFLSIIQALDTTFCAFPSGHVALPISLALASYLAATKTRSATSGFWIKISISYLLWAIAISISALLTGQHFVVDIYGGVIFGGAIASIVYLLSRVYLKTFTALVTEWLIVIAVMAAAFYMDTILAYIVAGIIIATRQHALLMLFHDGVHGLAADSRRTNDLIINALVGAPLLIPVHVYRAIHISHHRHLGTPKDPERLLLYWRQPWNYRPLKTASLLLQFLGDLSGFNSLIMTIRYKLIKGSDGAMDLQATRFDPDVTILIVGFACGVFVSLFFWPQETVAILLLWYLPYLTLTQFLQKVRSFAEHSLDEQNCFTYDWRPGLLGRLTIWPYNINYHREHHAHTNVPWDQLPAYADTRNVRPGKELIAHIWAGAGR